MFFTFSLGHATCYFVKTVWPGSPIQVLLNSQNPFGHGMPCHYDPLMQGDRGAPLRNCDLYILIAFPLFFLTYTRALREGESVCLQANTASPFRRKG